MGESLLFGAHLWFRLHVVFQLSGMVCFIVGFVYAWLYLPGSGNGPPTGGKVGQSHMILGTIIMGLAGLQVVVGFVRPKPDSSMRKGWNHLHHWLGRLTILSSWVVVYTGVYIAHESVAYQSSYSSWLIPIALVMGAIVLADIGCSAASCLMPPHGGRVADNPIGTPQSMMIYSDVPFSGEGTTNSFPTSKAVLIKGMTVDGVIGDRRGGSGSSSSGGHHA